MGRFQDLTGQIFGRLTVLKRVEDYVSPSAKSRRVQWLCRCGCNDHNEVIVAANNLKSGTTKSCGCLKNKGDRNKKYNDYEVQDGYVIMYTTKNESFLVSLEDFWKVKNICWHTNSNGYIMNKSPNEILLSRLVMNCPNDLLVDHKDGDFTNNLQDNLRIATYTENNLNRKISSYNSSGTTGVSWDKRRKKWHSYITINHKRTTLGFYSEKEDAIKVRKEAEEKYFGEWSYDNSRRII